MWQHRAEPAVCDCLVLLVEQENETKVKLVPAVFSILTVFFHICSTSLGIVSVNRFLLTLFYVVCCMFCIYNVCLCFIDCPVLEMCLYLHVMYAV